MACHLLSEWGFSTDELKSRLGHKPSSRAIDKYVNYLALNKVQPKRKIYESNIKQLETEIKEMREREKIKDRKVQKLQEFLDKMEKRFK